MTTYEFEAAVALFDEPPPVEPYLPTEIGIVKLVKVLSFFLFKKVEADDLEKLKKKVLKEFEDRFEEEWGLQFELSRPLGNSWADTLDTWVHPTYSDGRTKGVVYFKVNIGNIFLGYLHCYIRIVEALP